MRPDPVTALTIITAALLVVSLPPAVIAATVILLLLGTLTVAIWNEVTPLWRGEPTPPDEETET